MTIARESRPTSVLARCLPVLIAGLQLLGLAVTAIAQDPETDDEEIEFGNWLPMPAPSETAFLMLADGRRIDGVWEVTGETGGGGYVLTEALGTEQERPFSLEAGDSLEASLHYLPPDDERLFDSMYVELTLYRADTNPENIGAIMRAMDAAEVAVLPRKAGELVISEPFRLTAPTALDAEVLSVHHGWFLLVSYSPGSYGGPHMDLAVDFPEATPESP